MGFASVTCGLFGVACAHRKQHTQNRSFDDRKCAKPAVEKARPAHRRGNHSSQWRSAGFSKFGSSSLIFQHSSLAIRAVAGGGFLKSGILG